MNNFKIRRNLKTDKFGGVKGHFQIREYGKNDSARCKKGGAHIVEYVNPNTHSVILHGCRLYNSSATATRIYNGSHREVCSYVIFESYEIVPLKFPEGSEIAYNPKVHPFFYDEEGHDIDNTTYSTIITSGVQLFTNQK